MKDSTFSRMSSYVVLGAGVSALLYAYFFVIAREATIYSLFLLLLGLFSLEAIIILYGKLKPIHEDMARIATVLGVIGAAGMAIHGGYDLANAINPPASLATDLPNQVDPRGLLAFGFMGAAILKISYLMSKSKSFPQGLSYLGFVSGGLLVVIYIARLTVLDPTNPILLYPVLLNGFILSPAWYLWLGYWLLKKG